MLPSINAAGYATPPRRQHSFVYYKGVSVPYRAVSRNGIAVPQTFTAYCLYFLVLLATLCERRQDVLIHVNFTFGLRTVWVMYPV